MTTPVASPKKPEEPVAVAPVQQQQDAEQKISAPAKLVTPKAAKDSQDQPAASRKAGHFQPLLSPKDKDGDAQDQQSLEQERAEQERVEQAKKAQLEKEKREQDLKMADELSKANAKAQAQAALATAQTNFNSQADAFVKELEAAKTRESKRALGLTENFLKNFMEAKTKEEREGLSTKFQDDLKYVSLPVRMLQKGLALVAAAFTVIAAYSQAVKHGFWGQQASVGLGAAAVGGVLAGYMVNNLTSRLNMFKPSSSYSAGAKLLAESGADLSEKQEAVASFSNRKGG